MSTSTEAALQTGYALRRDGRSSDAYALLNDAVAQCRADQDFLLAEALAALAQMARDLQRPEESITLYREAAALFRAESNPLRLAYALRHLADVSRETQSMLEAKAHYAEALALYREHGNTRLLDIANTLRGLALTYQALKQPDEAKAGFLEAREHYTAVRVQAGIDECNRHL